MSFYAAAIGIRIDLFKVCMMLAGLSEA